MKDFQKQRRLSQFINIHVLANQTLLVQDVVLNYIQNNTFDNFQNFITNYYPSKDSLSAQEEIIERIAEMNDADAGTGEHPTATDADYRAWATEEWESNSNPQEIYEWWLVTDCLANKLITQGQPVLETDHGRWWGRTCTGQAIYMDDVMAKIADM